MAAQVEVQTLARQKALQKISKIVPGVTTVREAGARVYYSATSKSEDTVQEFPPEVRYFLPNPDYVLQPCDLFRVRGGGGPRGSYMDFSSIDTKTYANILREGKTKVPDFLQKAYNKAIAGQWIMRPHMGVGMTAGESLDAMVKAMEDAGCIYTPFTDDGRDYQLVQKALANK